MDTDGNGKISADELQTQIQNAQGKSYFYLTADVELASTYVVAADKNLCLCLNGHSLTGTMSDGPVIQVAGQLILTDCSEAETGKVTHEAGKTGSGIYCTADGQIHMYGGSITGNSATGQGGGVALSKVCYLDGSIKISGNTAGSGTTDGCNGRCIGRGSNLWSLVFSHGYGQCDSRHGIFRE